MQVLRQLHQPDVASEVTKHEDDLIRYAGITIPFDAYTEIGSPSASPEAETTCRARRDASNVVYR
jgi:hypothetical protein